MMPIGISDTGSPGDIVVINLGQTQHVIASAGLDDHERISQMTVTEEHAIAAGWIIGELRSAASSEPAFDGEGLQLQVGRVAD